MRQRKTEKQPRFGIYVYSRPCACGKRGYRARAEAKTVIKEMRRKGDPDASILHAYRCDLDSDYWHVGHDRTVVLRPNLNESG